MKRREFLSWVGLGTLATSIPVAIAACSSPIEPEAEAPTTPPEAEEVEIDTTPRADGFAAIGTVAALDADGYVGDKNFNGEQVAVIRDPGNAENLIAVNAFCPHQGCTVKWDGASKFACPCHGSSFNTDGSVATGPATKELGTFTAMIEGDLVYVKLS
ncbi:MAG: Rieske 2Fe-2S domain-containing protein [Limnothrix sp. RL_2_0]|nr:Rieske 2Fe-2S domain-containing protein [Limnothrix sp. RL_2_0]